MPREIGDALAQYTQAAWCTGKDTKIVSPGLAMVNRKQQSHATIAGLHTPSPVAPSAHSTLVAFVTQQRHTTVSTPSLSHSPTSSAARPLWSIGPLHNLDAVVCYRATWTRCTRFLRRRLSAAMTFCCLPLSSLAVCCRYWGPPYACTNDRNLQDVNSSLSLANTVCLLQGTTQVCNTSTNFSTYMVKTSWCLGSGSWPLDDG